MNSSLYTVTHNGHIYGELDNAYLANVVACVASIRYGEVMTVAISGRIIATASNGKLEACDKTRQENLSNVLREDVQDVMTANAK